MDQAQLTEIERLSSALYAGVGNGEREEAQKQLLTLQSSVEHVGTCRAIIQNSENSYALIVAANSLEVLITKFGTTSAASRSWRRGILCSPT